MTVPTCCGISVPRYLCRSRTGQFWILIKTAAVPGDLVLCRSGAGEYVIRRYAGQACLGVLYLAPPAGRAGSLLPLFSSRDEFDTVPGHTHT